MVQTVNTYMAIGTHNNPKVDARDFLESWSKLPEVAFVTG